MPHISLKKESKLFVVCACIFVAIVITAEIIGVKIFSLENALGMDKLNLKILRIYPINLEFTSGVIIWPLVFILTDIMNEYFGFKGVQFISILTAILASMLFIAISISIWLPPADWWSNQSAFETTLAQSNWIIVGSLCAFLLSQFLDAFAFKKLKELLNNSNLWLRATLSTLVSQIFDSFLVLYVAFYIGGDWDLNRVLAIALVNYTFKSLAALILSPLLYVARKAIDSYLKD